MLRRLLQTPSRRALLAASGAAASLATAAAAASAASAEPPPQPAAPPPPPPPASGGYVPAAVTAPFNYVADQVYDYVIAPYAEPSRDKLLPDIPTQIKGREKPTLVISLDGTLIESQWSRQFGWRYIKRPGVDAFLAQLMPHYELVLWTDSLSTADQVVDRLDPRRCFRHRLYRDATTYSGGMHRKDLSALNRDLSRCLIIDCDANSYSLQPGAPRTRLPRHHAPPSTLSAVPSLRPLSPLCGRLSTSPPGRCRLATPPRRCMSCASPR
jgi:hypothetical protein